MPRLALVLLLLVAGCDRLAVVVPPADDSTIPELRRERYREAAARLAARELPPDAGPELPAALVESFYARLVLVDNARELAARDTVVEVYGITPLRPVVRSLAVGVDRDAGWIHAWRAGQPLTGEAAVDELVRRFGITVDRCYDFASVDYTSCALTTERPVFVPGLARLFGPLDRVRYAEPNGLVGDGNDLAATREADAVVLAYSVGSGDCPAGCIHRRFWRFRVFDDGRVAYLGADGTPP